MAGGTAGTTGGGICVVVIVGASLDVASFPRLLARGRAEEKQSLVSTVRYMYQKSTEFCGLVNW